MVQVDEAKCSGCGACVTACPVDVIRLDPVKAKAVIVHLDDCCVCFLCQDDCPTGAMKVNHDSSSPRLHSIYDILNVEMKDFPKDK